MGRCSLYSSTKASTKAWRSSIVVGWSGWPRSHFFIVCWNRSTLPQVVGGRVAGGGVLLGDPERSKLEAVAGVPAPFLPPGRESGLGDAVLGSDIADGSVLDHHGGDQQSVSVMPGRWNPVHVHSGMTRGISPACLESQLAFRHSCRVTFVPITTARRTRHWLHEEGPAHPQPACAEGRRDLQRDPPGNRADPARRNQRHGLPDGGRGGLRDRRAEDPRTATTPWIGC